MSDGTEDPKQRTKVEELKQQVTAAAKAIAVRFYDLDRHHTNRGRCGNCHPCMTSILEMMSLFADEVRAETVRLHEAETGKKPPEADPVTTPVPKDLN